MPIFLRELFATRNELWLDVVVLKLGRNICTGHAHTLLWVTNGGEATIIMMVDDGEVKE